MRTSIKDVAALAGVSIGTVSNVLNRPLTVRPETRGRVEQAIATLGFVRNESARQLRTGSSKTMAYVMLDGRNPYFMDVAKGIDEVIRAQDLVLFLCDSDQDAVRQDRHLEQLVEQRVRGLCITPVGTDDEQLRRLLTRGVPLVVVDHVLREVTPSMCSVGVDDRLGGELGAMHLLELGHDGIAFVGGPTTVRQVRDRLAGARQAAERSVGGGGHLTLIETSALTVDDGFQAAARVMGLPRRIRPTGIFCANDLLALGLLQGLNHLGATVPEDFAIVGYDDIQFAGAAAVPLTSVSQPRRLIGQTAAQLLLEETTAAAHQHRQVVFEPTVVVRRSTQGGSVVQNLSA